MFPRILAIALNTYREAVRARVLLGVFALGLATCLYSVVVATLSLGNEARVIADLGTASLSLYGVVVAIVVGSTSLYRELEYKTIFPILSRPIRRWEYLVGKYFGLLLTLVVFAAFMAAAILGLVALETGSVRAGPAIVLVAVHAIALLVRVVARGWIRERHVTGVYVALPWAIALAVLAWFAAANAPAERQLVTASVTLSICEFAIVAAVAMLFASFSSPFLTATFTAMVFVIGRSADTLGHMPKRAFGAEVATGGRWLSHVFPNLHVYVPARPLLLGQVVGQPVWGYVGWAALHAVFYAAALLAIGALAFRKRDFS